MRLVVSQPDMAPSSPVSHARRGGILIELIKMERQEGSSVHGRSFFIRFFINALKLQGYLVTAELSLRG